MDPAPEDPFKEGWFPKPRALREHYGDLVEALLGVKATRRSMLIGVTGLSAALPLFGPLARAASNFVCDASDDAVTFSISGVAAWRIDRRWFDGVPRLEVRQCASRIHVRLRNARFPGTDVSADCFLRARRHGAEWIASLRFDHLGFACEFPFHSWLLGLHRVTGSIDIGSLKLRATHDIRFDGVRGFATFGPDWTLDIDRLRDASICVETQRAAMRAMRIELFRARLERSSRDENAVSNTAIWPSLNGEEPLHLNGTTPRVSLTGTNAGVFLRAASNSLQLLTRQHDGHAQLHWAGRTTLCLRAQRVDCAFSYADGMRKARGLAQVTKKWLEAADFAAEFGPSFGDGKILLVSNDTGSDDAFEGMASGAPLAHRFVVSLPGCDAAVFRLRGTGRHDAERTARYRGDITAFARRRIPLDDYDLDVRRITDAFIATLRFRYVDLAFTIHGWRLEPRKGAPDAPLIEYDFGSQHLLEEAVYVSDWACVGADASCKPSNPNGPDFPLPAEVAALALLQAAAEGTWSRLPNPPLSLAALQAKNLSPNSVPQLLEALNAEDSSRSAFRRFRSDPALRAYLKGTHARTSSVRAERAGASRLVFELRPASSIPLTLDALLSWASGSTTMPASRALGECFCLRLPRRAQPAKTMLLPGETNPNAPVIFRPSSLAVMPGASIIQYLSPKKLCHRSRMPMKQFTSGRSVAASSELRPIQATIKLEAQRRGASMVPRHCGALQR